MARGLEALRRNLTKLEEEIGTKVALDMAMAGAILFREAAAANLPGGKLGAEMAEQLVTSDRGSSNNLKLSVIVTSGHPLSETIEWGSGIHTDPDAPPTKSGRQPYPIVPINGKYLMWRELGKQIFAKKVMHPGNLPYRFLRLAMAEHGPEIIEYMIKAGQQRMIEIGAHQ